MEARSSLHRAAQIDQTRRRLGKLGNLDQGPAGTRPALRLVEPSAPPTRLSFPLGAFTRTIDSLGRLKFNGQDLPTATLGWQPGALQVTAVEGWLLLTQPPHLVGTTPRRYSSHAVLTVAGSTAERVTLRPAHLAAVGVPANRQLLAAFLPDASALLLVDPAACLSGAPPAVSAAFTIPTGTEPTATRRRENP